MTFVSVTRLRIRSVRFLPDFGVDLLRTRHQLRRASGLRDGSLMADGARVFWTMTLWDDRFSMRAYMSEGSHRAAMPRLSEWCDEASVVHWEAAALPSWADADRRMRAGGRPSPVLFASAAHATLAFNAPRAYGSLPIRPVIKPTSFKIFQ